MALELGDVLDKLTCLAATFLEYEQDQWLSGVIDVFTRIYSMPLDEGDAERFGYAARIDPQEKAPRIWLLGIERIFALGALAVRRRNWSAVRDFTLQHPERLTEYDANWLRHGLTMASRAQHLEEQRDGQTIQLSLLSLTRNDIARLECLRPDGVASDDDAILTSLTQFDFLSNIVAIDRVGSVDGRVFYTSFARFRQHRIQPVADAVIADEEMRQVLFTRGDEDLAIALATIGDRAQRECWRFDGFDGWDGTPVADFIEEHLPASQE